MSATVASARENAYFQALINGDRAAARQLITEAISEGVSVYELLNGLVWPTMEHIQSQYRDDALTMCALNLATRLNRAIADQLTAQLERQPANGKKVLVFCGNNEPEELGGQICADLFEANGWCVRFAGGGVPEDEVLAMIGQERPDLLVMFATLASGVPMVRKLIDYLRDVNSCPDMQVMCCGGIYKRAEGLAEEIGADLYAPAAAEAVEVANANPAKKATVEQQTVGRMRRLRRAAARKTQQVRRLAPTGPDDAETA